MQSLHRLFVFNINQPLKYSTTRGQIILNNMKKHVDMGITSLVVNNITKRRYCEQKSVRKFPVLMDFPERIWPAAGKSLKNWFLANFIIAPRIDRDFHIKTFIQGSKKAVQAITQAMSQGDFNTLKNLVTEEAYDELHTSVSKLSMSQREELSLTSEDDIYFQFPYEIGLIYEDNSKRSVEITMVYHVFWGLNAYKEIHGEDAFQIGPNPPYKDRLYVLNYRFLREYWTEGGDSGWIVNIVNHICMEDIMNNPPPGFRKYGGK